MPAILLISEYHLPIVWKSSRESPRIFIALGSTTNGELLFYGQVESQKKLQLLIIIKMKRLSNIHPGEVLLEEFLLPLDISAYRLAKDLGIPQTRISQILLGKSDREHAGGEDLSARLRYLEALSLPNVFLLASVPSLILRLHPCFG